MRNFVRCPTCDRKLMVATTREGKRLRCPRCAARFVLGNRIDTGTGGRAEYLAFEVFGDDPADDEIEVLDEEEPVAVPASAAVAALPVLPPAYEAPPKESGRTRRPARRHRDDRPDWEYEDELASVVPGEYQYDPRDQGKWYLAQWGVTLVLIPLVLFLASFVLSFIALFTGTGSGLEIGGLLMTGGIVGVACDGLRLAGYALGLNTPGKPINRIWLLIALIFSLGGGGVLVIPVVAAEALREPALVVGLFASGISIGVCGWGAYLMYLEGVAEMFNERGIADSISGLIKLGSTYLVCIIILFVSLIVMLSLNPGSRGASTGDPTEIVFGVCWGSFSAFTAILGLVVFIKYILALLNIRAMIEART